MKNYVQLCNSGATWVSSCRACNLCNLLYSPSVRRGYKLQVANCVTLIFRAMQLCNSELQLRGSFNGDS